MVVPAGLYALFNAGKPAAHGWGVPMATDIAFALGVMLLLGSRVPYALKVFLVAVAIADDIGAVLVIAIFYSGQLSMGALGVAAGFLIALGLVNWIVVRSPLVYMILGFGLWLAVLQSGVHATVAGVALALMIPARVFMNPSEFVAQAREAIEVFDHSGDRGHTMMTEAMQVAVRDLERSSQRVQMPLERLEDNLGPWVRYGIMPIFAFANAGVVLGGGVGEALASPIGLGIILGLVLGKPIGLFLFSFLAVKARVAELPVGVAWGHVLGAGFVAGIGFTMSLFIAELAFTGSPETLRSAKIAVLTASLIAGTIGFIALRWGPRGRRHRLKAKATLAKKKAA
jgi:NhaA family Na+:H+ antiporter